METPEECYQHARALWAQGRFKEGLETCKKGVEMWKGDAEACAPLYYMGGQIYMKMGLLNEAIGAYDHLLDIEEWRTVGAINKGVLFSITGRYDEALEAFDTGLEMEPGNVTLLYNKALCLMQAGRDDEALSVLESLNGGEDGSRMETLMMMAQIYDSMGRHTEAVACYDRILEEVPGSVKASNMKAIVLGEMGRYEEALEGLDAVLEAEPENTEIIATKGIILYEMEEYANAVACMDTVLEIEGPKPHRNHALLRVVREVRFKALRGYAEERKAEGGSEAIED